MRGVPVRVTASGAFLGVLLAIGALCLLHRMSFAKTWLNEPNILDDECDFGQVITGVSVEHVFLIRNPGLKPIEILSVTPACDCTSIHAWDRIVRPGGVGRITARLETRNISGDVDKRIVVKCSDPEKPTMVLRFKGLVSSQIELSAFSVNFGILSETAEYPKKNIVIANRSDKPLRFEIGTSPDSFFQVKLTETSRDTKTALEVQICRPLKRGLNSGTIYLESKNLKTGRIEIAVSAYLPEPVYVRPVKILLPSGRLLNPLKKSIEVVSAKKQVLELSEVKINTPEVDVQTMADGHQRWVIDLTFPAGWSPLHQKVFLSFLTNDANYPAFKIPIALEDANGLSGAETNSR